MAESDIPVGGAAPDSKQVLYAWLGKRKETPEYNVRQSGPKHRQHFLCELRVQGHAYTACGNSTSKKDAQTNAAKDFLVYLVRQGMMAQDEIPNDVGGGGGGGGKCVYRNRTTSRELVFSFHSDNVKPFLLSQLVKPVGNFFSFINRLSLTAITPISHKQLKTGAW